MDAQVQVKAKDGDPGEAADEDKVEEVAKKAAHIVPCQSAKDSESEEKLTRMMNIIKIAYLTNLQRMFGQSR